MKKYDGIDTVNHTQQASHTPNNNFPLPPEYPTQKGPRGILYDFNEGARVYLPKGDWHIELYDADTHNILFVIDTHGGWVLSTKKFYVRFGIKVWLRNNVQPLFEHEMNLKDKNVCIHLPIGTLGDILAWFPYVEEFRKKHACIAYYTMDADIAELFQETYPELTHINQEKQPKDLYASYRLGLFFDDEHHHSQPMDFRLVGLHKTAAYILGVETQEMRPRVILNAPRTIPEPYVCIAVQASTQCKKWNNPTGWSEIIRHLKSKGYRVFCIDKDAWHGQAPAWTYAPHEAEDMTGNKPLSERIAILQHADAFIGLASGLAWLAWACKIPVVLISGFSLALTEFYTPYRVLNVHTCNGCWNDVRHQFDHFDFFWCPRHKGTPRQFECTRLITAQQVTETLDAALIKGRILQEHAQKYRSRYIEKEAETHPNIHQDMIEA